MSTRQYEITFELYNGQWLTIENYDGNVTISEVFLSLKISYDWVEELNLDSEWIVESKGTKKVLAQCEDSISTVLGNQYQDTFTFQKNGTIGLEIFKWQLNLPNKVESQTSKDNESIMNYNNFGEYLFIEEEFQEALLNYFVVLTMDPLNKQATLGIGNCLAFLKCNKCLMIFEMLLKRDPENDDYKFYKAKDQTNQKNFKKLKFYQISLNKQVLEKKVMFNRKQQKINNI